MVCIVHNVQPKQFMAMVPLVVGVCCHLAGVFKITLKKKRCHVALNRNHRKLNLKPLICEHVLISGLYSYKSIVVILVQLEYYRIKYVICLSKINIAQS